MTITLRNEAATAVALLRAQHATLGLPVPAELDGQALADLDQLTTRAESQLAPDSAALAAGVVAALAAGTDPAADPAVVRELARITLAGNPAAVHAAEAHVTATARATLAGLFPALLDVWVPEFEAAAATLDRTRAEVPGLDLTEAAEAIRLMAPAKMAAASEAHLAAVRAEAITDLWALVAKAARVADVEDHRRQPLIVAELTADQYDQLGSRPSVRAVIAAGLPLSLATPAQHAERVAALDADRAAREAAREQARRDAQGSAFRFR